MVHRALDERGDIYALKLFASNAHIEQHSSKEFKRESESATFVSHQNIIRIFEAGVEESIPYVLMEFIDGINLSERLDQIGPLREEVAIAVGIDVCKALDFVWNEEMKIHRDIKPQNIMISKAGDVKVCDFGMVVDHDASMVDLDNVEGTPYYLSPECISEGAYLDNRSDIYSLGASLYHVVSGFPPFDYGSVMKVIQARTKEDPPDVRK